MTIVKIELILQEDSTLCRFCFHRRVESRNGSKKSDMSESTRTQHIPSRVAWDSNLNHVTQPSPNATRLSAMGLGHETWLSPNVTQPSPIGLGHPTEVGIRPDPAESHMTRRVDSDSAMNELGPEACFLNLACNHSKKKKKSEILASYPPHLHHRPHIRN